MYKKNEFINRIIAIFMCILLLSNFGLNITLATNADNEGRAGDIIFYNSPDGVEPEIYETHQTEAYYYISNKDNLRVTFKPLKTAIYTITVSAEDLKAIREIPYIVADSNGQLRLAARYGNGKYTLLTPNKSSESTTVDVILEKDVLYTINAFPSDKNDESVIISMKRRNIQLLAMAGTNIPSGVISYKDPYQSGQGMQIYEDKNIKIVEFNENEINKYLNDGTRQNEGDVSKGGTFEGIITDLIIAFGSVFVTIIEWAVNANVPLTIDNIIFNKFEQTVIDLSGLGGMQIAQSMPYAGKGIFNDPSVGAIIKTMYDSLKTLAIVIYIVMLLYIGVKIFISIGGKDQSKYLKYLEYWLTGIILLAVLPYFIPVIPAAANAVVGMLQQEAKSLNGDYSVAEVLERLSGDASFLGEDPEVIELHNIIDEKIEGLNQQINGTPATREEAQANIEGNIQVALGKFHGDLTEQQLSELRTKIDNVTSIIDSNYYNWNSVVQEEYEKTIQDIKDYILKTVEVGRITENINTQVPQILLNDESIVRNINFFGTYIKNNAGRWNLNPYYQVVYNNRLQMLRNMMKEKGYSDEQCARCTTAIDVAKRQFINYTSSEAFTGLEKLFEEYKNAVIQMEIKELQDLKSKISNDVMTTLKLKAQSENRVVYAIAWIILLYQMIAILMMYYKRVFVILILIVIFPVVMAFYVIDKSGDGESQSLSNWLKEFLAIILVQIVHAGVYVVLVNMGIEACNVDPSKNWFFLILTVCFIFPAERIVRSIVGLNSSAIDGLKNNIAGTIAGVAAVRRVAKNGYRTAKSGIKNVKDKKFMEDYKNNEAKIEKKKKEKKDLGKSKERIKKYRQQENEQKRKERQKAISEGNASKWDKAKEKGSELKDTVKNSSLGKAVGGAVAGAVNTGKKFNSWRKSSKVLKGVGKAARIGKYTLKKGLSVGQKGFGLTMGAVEGMENFAQGGPMSSFHTARSVAKSMGGFKDKKNPVRIRDVKEPSQFKTLYNGGSVSSGGGETSVSNRININASGKSTSVAATKIRSKMQVHFDTQNKNTP